MSEFEKELKQIIKATVNSADFNRRWGKDSNDLTERMVTELTKVFEREVREVTRYNVHVDELIQEQEKLQEAIRTIMAFAERDSDE